MDSMDLMECYEKMEGNYNEAITHLLRKTLIERFVLKFLDDDSYKLYIDSMEVKNYEEALRGVHTLKGVAQNLSFTALYKISDEINLALKANNIEEAKRLSPELTKIYNNTIASINEYKSTKEGN